MALRREYMALCPARNASIDSSILVIAACRQEPLMVEELSQDSERKLFDALEQLR